VAQEAQGTAAFPEGNNIPKESSLLMGSSILRGEEQDGQCEQD